MTNDRVSRVAAAELVEQLVAERGGITALASEIAHTTGRPRSGIERLLYQIRIGKRRREDGTAYVEETISFDSLDLILTGCGRPDLLYSGDLTSEAAA